MIECPNCGMDNPPSRAFCRICGERLPQETEPVAETAVPSAENQAAPPSAEEDAPAINLDWLLEEESDDDEEAATSGVPEESESEAQTEAEEVAEGGGAASYNHLPEWLQSNALEAETAEQDLDNEIAWDADLDFSDLPDWSPDEVGQDATGLDGKIEELEPTYEPWEDPIQSPEREGSGLLSGVKSPIPVEPVITITHDAPPFPGQPNHQQDDEAVNLFSRIAGGAVVPDPIPLPEAPPRLVGLLHLLLVVIVGTTLFVNPQIFGRPPASRSVTAFGQVIDALPGGSTVLVAFDFEGGMGDELMPGAIATLNRIRSLPKGPDGPRDNIRLIAVSTSPQGPALAENAWRASEGSKLTWENKGYLAGGPIALRTLLVEQLQQDREPTEGMADLSLVIVIGNETLEIQQWIEQVGAQLPEMPMLAIAPTLSETTLMPYLASGQLDGLLAGLPGAVSYEVHFLQQGGIAWRRIDAISLAALFILLVIVVGNLVAVKRHLLRKRQP